MIELVLTPENNCLLQCITGVCEHIYLGQVRLTVELEEFLKQLIAFALECYQPGEESDTGFGNKVERHSKVIR